MPIPPELWGTFSFRKQKHAEFERLTRIEYPELPLAKRYVGDASEYTDPRTEKLWTYWLQAYEQGKRYLDIERPEE